MCQYSILDCIASLHSIDMYTAPFISNLNEMNLKRSCGYREEFLSSLLSLPLSLCVVYKLYLVFCTFLAISQFLVGGSFQPFIAENPNKIGII